MVQPDPIVNCPAPGVKNFSGIPVHRSTALPAHTRKVMPAYKWKVIPAMNLEDISRYARPQYIEGICKVPLSSIILRKSE